MKKNPYAESLFKKYTKTDSISPADFQKLVSDMGFDPNSDVMLLFIIV